MFKRRTPLPYLQWFKEGVYPRSGWRRVLNYGCTRRFVHHSFELFFWPRVGFAQMKNKLKKIQLLVPRHALHNPTSANPLRHTFQSSFQLNWPALPQVTPNTNRHSNVTRHDSFGPLQLI